eukprot:TRINITY_DN12947_c0_g1_i1.p1 TRINITY_DN12947_c0_g1~~TRINITY_DN12947_c0_g1_i1.p1  ORF type:complete len:163 (-),score=18.94 TRINITY_DN12947_c0_g1_i1:293-751(-)
MSNPWRGVDMKLYGEKKECRLKERTESYIVDIHFSCITDHSMDANEFYAFQLSDDPCHYTMQVLTEHACPLEVTGDMYPSNDGVGGGGGGSGGALLFLVLVMIIIASSIFVCGYKYQGGARGLEVLPFYGYDCGKCNCYKPKKRRYSQVNIK